MLSETIPSPSVGEKNLEICREEIEQTVSFKMKKEISPCRLVTTLGADIFFIFFIETHNLLCLFPTISQNFFPDLKYGFTGRATFNNVYI